MSSRSEEQNAHSARPLRVNILLPDFSREPVGGLKVQYEFANRLSGRGHDVAIYHSRNFEHGFIRHPRSIPGLVRWNTLGRRMLSWFALDPAIGCYFLPTIRPLLLRRADATIFNAFMIADQLPRSTARTGPLVEVVYEYPVWKCGTPELKAHLKRSLQRSDVAHVATSLAVEEMLAEFGVTPATKIMCGIDLPPESLVVPTAEREPIVGFPLRPEKHKGTEDALAAAWLISKRQPEVRFECFGRFDGELDLPPNAVFHGYLNEAELRRLYQRCQVFILPSHAEGWGLPAAEAMANGAALVVAENGGSRDFAIDGVTARVVPISRPDAIAEAVGQFIGDAALRERIVGAARARCQTMTWERPVAQLESLLQALSGGS